MYGRPDKALDLLTRSANSPGHRDRSLPGAIREAMVAGISVEQIATLAGTTIDNVLAMADERSRRAGPAGGLPARPAPDRAHDHANA